MLFKSFFFFNKASDAYHVGIVSQCKLHAWNTVKYPIPSLSHNPGLSLLVLLYCRLYSEWFFLWLKCQRAFGSNGHFSFSPEGFLQTGFYSERLLFRKVVAPKKTTVLSLLRKQGFATKKIIRIRFCLRNNHYRYTIFGIIPFRSNEPLYHFWTNAI